MITRRSIDWLNKNYGSGDWEELLRDYTDDQIAVTVKKQMILNGAELLSYLYDHADPADLERRAHLLGFDCAADRQRLIDEVKALQEKCHDPDGDPEH